METKAQFERVADFVAERINQQKRPFSDLGWKTNALRQTWEDKKGAGFEDNSMDRDNKNELNWISSSKRGGSQPFADGRESLKPPHQGIFEFKD